MSLQLMGQPCGLQIKSNATVDELSKQFSACLQREITGHKKHCHALAWNCDGKLLASSSLDGTVRVWHLTLAIPQSVELKGHTDNVEALRWHPTNPDILATASNDKCLKVWDAKKGVVLGTVDLKGENINLAWSPDGEYISVGNKGDQIAIVETQKFKIMKKMQFTYEVNEFGWNNQGNLFFLTTGTATMEIFKFPDFTKKSFVAHIGSISCIAFEKSGKYFALSASDGLVSLWDANEIICLRSFSKLDYPVRTISFSHDGKFLAAGSEDTMVVVYAVDSDFSFTIQTGCPINMVTWNPKINYLAFAGDESKNLKGAIQVFGFANSNKN